jgi:hypothetical protein
VSIVRPLSRDIILETHSAFVSGHIISDNATTAFECIHALHSGSKTIVQFCAYKLDRMKEYDQLDS